MIEQLVIRLAPPPLELLFVDTDQATATFLSILQRQHHVTVASGAAAALKALERTPPAMVITELDLTDGHGEEICRRAKQLSDAPTVLVTTSTVERAPIALAAGCDGILLKPFAPNLLYARVGRLLRARSVEIRMRALQQRQKSTHLNERAAQLTSGTNQVWPTTHCPYCAHSGVINFDHASFRREWFACLACQKVWIARSHDHEPDRKAFAGEPDGA